MKTKMTIDYAHKTIICSKTFLEKASRYGTSQYNELAGIRRDYPDYEIKLSEQDDCRMSMKGLTEDFMEYHIALLNGKNSDAYKAYLERKRLSEAYTNPYMYLRKWFVEEYPNWDNKEDQRQKAKKEKEKEKNRFNIDNIVEAEKTTDIATSAEEPDQNKTSAETMKNAAS